MPVTLSLYIARQYCIYLLGVLCVAISIVVLFESVEMIRIMFGKQVGFFTILQMAFLKNFLHIQRAFGFIVLVAAIILYVRLNKNSELIIIRSSGMSVFQLVLPTLVVALLFGVIYITMLNPVASLLIARYEKLEGQHLRESPRLLTILKTGLWIKQTDKAGQKNIMHALKISSQNNELYDTTVYFLDNDNRFVRRLDAGYARLHDGKWELRDATETAANHFYEKHDRFELDTNITFDQIQESMVRPETLSFWKLPLFIKLAEDSGFPVVKHKLYFCRLLIAPLFFTMMALLGVAFALSNPRSGISGKLGALGLVVGFFIYFSSDVIYALGATGSIPIWLAAIAPTLITFAIGSYLHLHYENG